MTTVFSTTWQASRLGLRPRLYGRATFAIFCGSRHPIWIANQHLQHEFSTSIPSSITSGLSRRIRCSTPEIAARPPIVKVGYQSRWVSLWKRGQQPEIQESEDDVVVTEEEIDKMFGQRIDPDEAIELLMTLQRHRLAGTLDQRLAYPDSWIAKGLVWLRKYHPVDEDAAIVARIDREIENGVTVPQSNESGRHAVSQFEKRRRENKERQELERQKREAEKKKELQKAGNHSEQRLNIQKKKPLPPMSPTLVQLKKTGTEWVDKYREKAERQANEEVPESVVLSLSWMGRIIPSAAVVLSVVGLSILFAQNYTPPSPRARIWPDTPPAAATIITLIGINVAIFCAWRIPPLWRAMNNTFIVVHAYPRCLSMLGAAFSHQSFSHLLTNMVGLWFIGTRVHDDIGRGPFLAVYFSCAAISSFTPLLIQTMRGFFGTSSIGASGAICGLLATTCVLHEGRNIQVPFLPPEWTRGIDTGVVLAVFIILELLAIRKFGLGATPPKLENTSVKPLVDNLGHLSGYFAGIGCGAAIRSHDSYWKDLRRRHFFTRDFGKHDVQASLAKKMPPA